MNSKKAPDHSKVNPFNTGERRQHMQAVFRHLGLSFKEDWRPGVEDTVCKLLDSEGYRNSSISWFEWEVDKTIWSGLLKRKKIQDPAFQWPWDQGPDFDDLRAGFSLVYREWRTSRGLPVEELDPTKALQHKVPSKGEVSESGKSNPSSAAAEADQAEREIPAALMARRRAAEEIFAGEKAKIEVFKAGQTGMQRDGDGDTVISIDAPLPVRDEFGAHEELPSPCPVLPDAAARQQIWKSLGLETAGVPFPGCFELTLPPWMDFHDLVYGKDGALFAEIKRDNLIDKDLIIGWNMLNDRPVSLMVGPDPEAVYDVQDRQLWIRVRALWWRVIQWLLEVYEGRPLRLKGYLFIMQSLEVELGPISSLSDPKQLEVCWELVPRDNGKAARKAKAKRQTFDRQMPEIHAILMEPRQIMTALLEEWIDRAGLEFAEQRLDAVRYAWAIEEPGVAWRWCLEKHDKLNSPSP
ncbi:uncharacterized protein FTOL_08625 [Fusarium torulosum]|uniref:Uncharacterized protein n=1 Tax=Fusarium torulosum TaxID=33205 RepID=A0AAE8ME59_9HYPO|nr:uncharacterized protein FTOL_08625 [Fusarium torulosum]